MSSVTSFPDRMQQHATGDSKTGGHYPQPGWWTGSLDPDAGTNALLNLRRPVYVVDRDGDLCFTSDGQASLETAQPGTAALPLCAWLPALDPARLGDTGFCADFGLRFPYMTGAMANGIASTDVVIAIVKAGMLGSFGAAGLPTAQVAAAIDVLQRALGEHSFAINLIHSPNEKGKEDELVDLFIDKGIHLVEASAYLALTPAAVRYRLHGIHRDTDGRIVTPNRIIAKASRVEVATRWLSPAPAKILQQLLAAGAITAEQMQLAQQVPVAQDLIVEADSGGHTDNRPAITLLPTMLALRDRLQQQYRFPHPIRVGAAGGIATPMSAAAAYAMGAAFVVTGTINQACVESGSSDIVRDMLAQAEQADTAMAAAGDMFEMGVKLQVLKRGTMFPMRANKLFELYRANDSLDTIPAQARANLEKTVFRAPLEQIWEQTREYFQDTDPAQVDKAEADPKHKMALVFRWYLGLSSRWANAGVADRQADYQVWCGPAMGAFNEWTRGSHLQQASERNVVSVALNLVYGAALATRLNQLRTQGITVPADCAAIRPLTDNDLEQLL